MKLLASLLLFTAASGLALPAAAQFQTPESAIKYRQGAFSVMGVHFGRVAMMSQGILPFDAKFAAENADVIANMARLPFTAFTAGTDKGLPNRAKPEIWKDGAQFKAAADRMVAEVSKLQTAARAGNFDAMREASGAVGKSCKSCHDAFRGDTGQ